MKLKAWAWVSLAVLLVLCIGIIAFHSSVGFSTSIAFDGASYPRKSLYSSPAFPWTRDLSGRLGQLFLSGYSHLYKIHFSIDQQLIAHLMQEGAPDVQCSLYKLPKKPKHIKLKQTPTPRSVFWAVAVCQKKYHKRTAWTQTKDLLGGALKTSEIPLAHIAGQTFAATENQLCAITTILGRGPEAGQAKLAFHLISMDKPDNDLFTIEIEVNDIPKDQIVTFDFEPIEDSRFKRYAFYFTSPDSRPETAPRLMATNTDIEPNGTAWVNYRQEHFDFTFKPQYFSPASERLHVPQGVVVTQMSDVDLDDCEVVREGKPAYLGSEGSQHAAMFEFSAISGSSNIYYLLVVEVNGVSVPCRRFLCQHSAGTLLETMRHIVGTLMIDKPPCVKTEHIVILSCLLFFLLAVFVNWLGLPNSLRRATRTNEARPGERDDEVKEK